MVGLLILTLLWAAQQLWFPAPAASPGEPLLAFWNFAIPAALSIGNALINRGGDKKESAGQARMGAQATQDRARGGAAEDAYYDRVSNFDATEGAARTMDVLTRDWQRDTERGRERLTGQQVAAGRLDTGYGYEDQDRYGEDTRREFADASMRVAMQAQGQQRDADEALGRYGERTVGRGIDLDMTADHQKRLDKRGKLGALGGIASSLIKGGAQMYAAKKYGVGG